MSSRSRWIIVALLCVPVVAGIAKWKQREIIAAYTDWRFPAPQTPAVNPLGQEILRQEDQKSMNRYLREYQRIEALVYAAQTRGTDISVFKGRLKDSTVLARAGAFREAMSMLNVVEMGLPNPDRKIIPAPQGSSDETQGAPVEGRPVQATR